MKVITSQHHRDAEIIQSKIAALQGEASVTLPVVEVGMDDLYVLTDGHHTYEAAKALGLEINFRIVDATEDDRAGLPAEDLLEAMMMDGEYVYLETGALVW